MQNLLMEKLRAYIVHNNPELLLRLQGGLTIKQYLEDKVSGVMPMLQEMVEAGKPGYVIEELCMNALTEDLRPSKFHYLQRVLEEDFPDTYQAFRESGVLTYETVNLIEACGSVFETFGFSEENEDGRHLRYAIIAEIHNYLPG